MYELAKKPKYSYFSEYDDHMMEYNNKMLLNELKNLLQLKLSHNLNKQVSQIKINFF